MVEEATMTGDTETLLSVMRRADEDSGDQFLELIQNPFKSAVCGFFPPCEHGLGTMLTRCDTPSSSK